jgi:hypothetical protein
VAGRLFSIRGTSPNLTRSNNYKVSLSGYLLRALLYYVKVHGSNFGSSYMVKGALYLQNAIVFFLRHKDRIKKSLFNIQKVIDDDNNVCITSVLMHDMSIKSMYEVHR